MKKLNRISLTSISKAEMEKREQNLVRGGYCSFMWVGNGGCPCLYEGEKEGPNDSYYGGSSHEDSYDAN